MTRLATLTLTLLLIWGGMANVCSLQAASPGFISYQGRLTDSGGTPANGTYDMQFDFYENLTSTTPLHTENINNVPVTDGLFQVEIDTPLELFEGSVYLEVSINNEIVTPREPLASVPYAERVRQLDRAIAGRIYGTLDLTGSMSISTRLGVGEETNLAAVHFEGVDLQLDTFALQGETVIIEDDNAILGLYSDAGGSAGSGISLGEIDGGFLNNKWSIVRETDGGGRGLRFAYGLDENPFANSTNFYLDNNGWVGIGTLSPNYDLDVRGTIGNNSTQYHSDRRWKKDISTYDRGLDDIEQLRGITFEWRRDEFTDMNFPEGRHVGLVAQEVEKVIPEVVSTNPDGYKAVEYANLVAVLIEAVKELNTRSIDQSDQIEKLQAQIERLKARM